MIVTEYVCSACLQVGEAGGGDGSVGEMVAAEV